MPTQKEMEELALERDAAKIALEDMRMEHSGLAESYEKLMEKFNLAITQRDTALKACPPPESGVSINVSFTANTSGITITGGQLTLRGDKHSDAMDVLATLAHIVEVKKWKMSPAPTQAPPPVESKAIEIARESGNPAALAEVKQAVERIPDPPAGKTWQTMEIARLVITPEPGDLTTLAFYASGHKWPDLKANKLKAERAVGLLRHVTSADVTKAADMTLPCLVYFVNGNEKKDKPGEFWKDVHHVRPL